MKTKKKPSQENNDSILKRILSFVKFNSLWALLGTIAALIGVPAAIYAIKEHKQKPDISISIAGFKIPEDNPCNIYYLIPQEYYDGPMDGSVLFEMSNSGTSELSNVYAMIETQSVYDSHPTIIFSSGNAKTVEQQELRFRRLVEQEYYDDIAGEKISVSYNGFSECLTFVCRNLPKGMLKRIQPRYAIDREYVKKMESYTAEKDLGNLKGGKVFDVVFFDISYAATNVPAQKISHIPIIVTEEVGIRDILSLYENEGRLFGGTMFSPKDVENGYVNSILIYPKYVVENNVINVSIDDAQYYYIKFDTFFKEKKSRKITVVNLNNAQVETFEFKDTPERKARIKEFYDITNKGLQSRKQTVL